MLRARKNLGLAVTEQGITAVEVSLAGGRQVLRHWALVPFAQGINLDAPERLGKELKQVLRRTGITASHCVIGLPAAWTAARTKLLPVADAESLRGILSIAAETEFASGAQELEFDYVAGQSAKGISVLLVAAPRRVMNQLSTMAQAAGLTVTAVTSSAVALSLAWRKAVAPGECWTLCLLPNGAELTVSSGDGALRALRHLPVRLDGPEAAADLAGQLRRVMGGMSADAAAPSSHLLIWDCVGLEEKLLNQLGAELNCGWTAGELRSILDVEVTAGQTHTGQTPATRVAPAAALACGPDPAGLDFLHSRLAPPKKARIGRPMLLAAAAAVVLLAAGLYLVLDWHFTGQQADDLDARQKGQLTSVQAAQSLVDDVSFAAGWYDRRPHMLDCLREITQAFPDEGRIWATSLMVREDMQVLLTGKSISESAALEVLDRLKANPRLDQIKPLYIRQAGGNSREVSFAISLNLRGVK